MSNVLDDPVLVLNSAWQPVSFFDVKTAIVTVMRDMGSVMDTENFYLMSFEDWAAREDVQTERWIHTSRTRIAAPEVIVLKNYGERPPQRVGFTRPVLYRRDDWTCQDRGKELPANRLTIEHVMPRSRGGPTTFENCVAACKDCNQQKANRTPGEAGMKLRTSPRRPQWTPRLKLPKGVVRDSWEPFLAKEAVA